MQWHYLLKPELVSLLGLDQTGPKIDASSSYARPSLTVADQPGSESPDPVIAFLRRTNGVLVSLLTPEQKLTFLNTIARSNTVLSMVSPATRTELDAAIARLASAQQQHQRTRPQATSEGGQNPHQELKVASQSFSGSAESIHAPNMRQSQPLTSSSRTSSKRIAPGPSTSVLSMRSPSKPVSPRKRTRTAAAEAVVSPPE